MEHLGNGIVTLVNGVITTVTAVVDPVVLGTVILAACLWWMARLEIDELDRSASKPTVNRH